MTEAGGIGDWELLGEETVYKDWAHVVKRRYRLPDGTVDHHDVLIAPQVVSILALTEDERVLLVRQFRPGLGEVLNEMPGGGLEEGEDPAAGAARELLEETGHAGDMTRVGQSFQAAHSTMVKHVFAATNCRKVADLDLDPGEFIEPRTVTLAEFREHLRSGRLTDQGPGYMALDALGLL